MPASTASTKGKSRSRTAAGTSSSKAKKAVGGAPSAAASASSANARSRKSLAIDPGLYHSSGSEGEADDVTGAAAGGASTSKSQHSVTNVSRGGQRQPAATKANLPPASPSSGASPGTRRSTRLSGGNEDLVELDATRSPAPVKQSPSSSTNAPQANRQKRKVPPSPSRSGKAKQASVPARPTPPDTDPDANEQDSARQQQHGSKTTKAASSKKQKVEPSSAAPLPHTAPAKRSLPSPASDDSDDFTFTRLDAPSATAPTFPSTSSASILPPEGIGQSATNAPRPTATTKGSTKPSKTSSANANSSRHKSDSSRTVTAANDIKGKRRADDTSESIASADAPTRGPSGSSRDDTKASTSQRPKKGRTGDTSRKTSTQDPGTPPSTIVPVYTQETPAIQRNLAMRAGGLGMGTPGSAARRTSGDLRGRRGSSIGNGFEAPPHPSLPTNTLYKHIKLTDPPPVRFRTLATWSMHRLLSSLEEISVGASSSVRDGAQKAVQAIIDDLAEKRIELAWTASDEADTPDLRHLPPHPQNASNQAKLEACLAWMERLKAEDEARNARINQYKTMTESIRRLAAPPTPAPPDGQAELDDLLQPNWRHPLSKLKNRDDVLGYGRQLLTSSAPPPAPSRRNRGKEKQTEPEDTNILVDAEEELDIDLGELRPLAAGLHQQIHRLHQFVLLSDKFLKKHLETSYAALSHTTRGGRGAASSSSSVDRRGNSDSSSMRQESLGLQISVPGSQARLSPDPCDLLRALSRAEAAA